jgi:HK97 family phage major capsid protein
MPTVIELRQQRNNLVTLGRQIFEKADKEKREPTAEERTQFDTHMTASDELKKQIDLLDADDKRRAALKVADEELNRRDGRRTEPANPSENAIANAAKIAKRAGVGFEAEEDGTVRFVKRSKSNKGNNSIKVNLTAKMETPEMRTAFRGYLQSGRVSEELRSLQVDLDVAGGFLLVPQQYAAELIAIVDNQVFIRQLATVITLTSATSLGVPTRDVDIADSDWTSELATGNEDTALAFGKRELSPHPLAKRIKISNKLLRAGALDAESIVRDRLAYKFGVTQEKAFLLGTGSQQPLGLFVVNAGNGISTARDVVTGSATNYTADGLINAKYFLKPQYWPNARWGFHRFGIQRIRQLKDTNGQYLWNPAGAIGQASIDAGVSDQILGLPYFISEYIPSTFTTGLYTGILGDFSNYWIVDALGMQLQRLVELYAEKNQTGIIGRMELDGAPVLEEAFVRVINS